MWVLVHLLYLTLMVLLASAEGTSLPSIRRNPLWIVGLCAALALADVRRRGERALWGNLGFSSGQIALLAVLVAAAGELLVSAAYR